MEKFTHDHDHLLSEKAAYAVIVLIVLLYIAFVIYHESTV